jgi:preprotein translocase subunit SecF
LDLIKPNTHIEFVRKMGKALVVSGILILISIISLIYHKGPNWGVEFTGGTEIQIKLGKDLSVDEIRKTLTKSGYPAEEVQRLGLQSEKEYLIKFSPDIVKYNQIQGFQTKLEAIMKENPQFTGGSILRVDYIGPKVGAELIEKAIMAVLLGCIGILIYVMLRFEFAFAMGAVVALLHDTVITIGAISITNKEFTLAIIAALLTIIGYSVNDTIIIFDRIRENMRKGEIPRFMDIVNISVNQTLSRTLLTSLTVFLVLLSLFFLGGSVIHDFAFALIVGVLVGTYSSVFIASALVIYWRKYKGIGS